MKKNQTSLKLDIGRLIGIILLIPPVMSVLLFVINLFSEDAGAIARLANLSVQWTGDYGYSRDGGGGGFTSAVPMYLGLMAIAGAILLRKADNDSVPV